MTNNYFSLSTDEPRECPECFSAMTEEEEKGCKFYICDNDKCKYTIEKGE